MSRMAWRSFSAFSRIPLVFFTISVKKWAKRWLSIFIVANWLRLLANIVPTTAGQRPLKVMLRRFIVLSENGFICFSTLHWSVFYKKNSRGMKNRYKKTMCYISVLNLGRLHDESSWRSNYRKGRTSIIVTCFAETSLHYGSGVGMVILGLMDWQKCVPYVIRRRYLSQTLNYCANKIYIGKIRENNAIRIRWRHQL